MSTTSLVLRPNKPYWLGTAKTNVRIVCRADALAEYAFEADGYILRAVSGRFAQLLENVPLANHNNRKSKDKSGKDKEKEREKERRKSVNGSTVTFAPVDSDTLSLSSGSISSESTDHPPGPLQPPTQPPTQPATGNPHVLELKETGERMLLLLEFINYSTTGVAFATRTFTIRKLVTLLDLADTYKLKEGPRATLRNYIAKSAHALTLKASGYDDFLGLVRILEQTRSVALARALFRLDWDIERVRLLHLHHLAQPWEMPDDVVAKLSPEMFNAMVYVETERALWSGKVDDLVVSYSKSQLVFEWKDGESRVAFGDETGEKKGLFRRGMSA